MSTSRPDHRSTRLVLWIAASALAVACSGGDPSALDQARRSLDRGELETASAALADESGPLAAELRAEIAAGQKRRVELEHKLKVVLEAAPKREPRWTLTEFETLLGKETDPVNQARIRDAQLEFAGRLSGNGRPSAETKPAVAKKTPAPAPAKSAASAAGVKPQPVKSKLAQARDAKDAERWSSALALALEAQSEPASAAEAKLLHAAILKAARIDAELVLSRAKELERKGSIVEAAMDLRFEITRFPELEEFASLRFESELLNERAARQTVAATPRSPAASPGARASDSQLARAQSPEECVLLAKARASSGNLSGAREAWLEASQRRNVAVWREECERRARELELRIALRDELADFARVDAATAELLGVGASDGGPARFESIRLAAIRPALDRARVSGKARLGFWIESIVRGDETEREQALEGLGVSVQRSEIDSAHASSLVAQARGAIGEGGWVFRGGRWIEGKVAGAAAALEAQTEQEAKFAALVGEFRRSSVTERDRALENLRAVGDPELLKTAYAKRWEDDWERLLRHPNLRQLAALAEKRRALDEAREKALALIFDEVRYFYPYNPPECPPDKAATYAAVQREVDVLVGAVREHWDVEKRLKIGEGLREQLALQEWTAERAAEDGVKLEPVDPAWSFALALPAGNEVGISDFAWNRSERAALIESDRIEARNDRLWKTYEGAKPADDVPNVDEQRQVQVTNAYRRMLGRRALAWNPKLEAAAQGHSDYMANTGNFGHFEEGDPARRTPTDRMKLAGYKNGVSENCSMGRSDPKSAHEGWTQSSGHHRNILMMDHREMASAIGSQYWTQNYGVDAGFLADL